MDGEETFFCFFQTADTGNRTPNSGVNDSGANHYPRAPALIMKAAFREAEVGVVEADPSSSPAGVIADRPILSQVLHHHLAKILSLNHFLGQ